MATTSVSGSAAKKKTKRKKRPKNYYFHQGTEKAIIRYNKTDNSHLKNKIYNEHIRTAFDKLAENIIHTFKFYYFDVSSEEVKNEVVSFLVLNMHKFKEGKGKAFSYFSIVAKNYLILNNNKNYKMGKIHDKLDVMDYKRNVTSELTDKNRSELNDMFTDEWVRCWEQNLPNIFKKQRDLNVAYSILDLMKQIDEIENFNKKSLYILIREMTDVNTSHITSVVNVLKKHYKKLSNEYYKSGTITPIKSGSFF